MNTQVMYHPSGKVELVAKDSMFLPNVLEGFHKVVMKSTGMGTSMDIFQDKEISIPRGSQKLLENYTDVSYVDDYFGKASRSLHKDLGLTHKLGILWYGLAGTGKTTMAYALSQYFIHTQKAVVITVRYADEYNVALQFLREMKAQQGDFMSITIFDECENAMQQNEDFMKRELDSTYSLNNHLHLFTTNYIEKVPDAIKSRKSRIKFCTEVFGVKDEFAVFEILDSMNQNLNEAVKLPSRKVELMVKDLVGQTLDEIKNKFIDESFLYNYEMRRNPPVPVE